VAHFKARSDEEAGDNVPDGGLGKVSAVRAIAAETKGGGRSTLLLPLVPSCATIDRDNIIYGVGTKTNLAAHILPR
jgi:hypothetical protein